MPRMELLKDEVREELDLTDFVKNAYEQAVGEIEVLPTENETETRRRQIGYLNIRFFMQTLLNRMDRTSMRWGLEARVPFADRKLVEYVFNIPWEMKAKNGVVKNVLRSSSIGKLPDEILFRKKSPYPKSYHPFYEELLGKFKEGMWLKISGYVKNNNFYNDFVINARTIERSDTGGTGADFAFDRQRKDTAFYCECKRLWKAMVWAVNGRTANACLSVADQ